MNNKGLNLRIFVLLILLFNISFAEKPIRVDNLLTEENKFKLDITLSYSNIQTSSNLSASETFQTQNGDFITIPTYLGISKSNRDYTNFNLTFRYGFSKDLELFTSIDGYKTNTKFTLPKKIFSQSAIGFNALHIGATYQLKPEGETPSLLIGASTQLIGKTKFNNKTFTHHLKSFRIFATSFYSVDPIVFMLSSSYSFNNSKNLGKIKRDDADIFTLTPQIYFAVNPYTSINWGIKYKHFGKTTIDGTPISNSGSSLSFTTGATYEFSQNTFINVNAEFLNTNLLSQNTFAITLSYNF